MFAQRARVYGIWTVLINDCGCDVKSLVTSRHKKKMAVVQEQLKKVEVTKKVREESMVVHPFLFLLSPFLSFPSLLLSSPVPSFLLLPSFLLCFLLPLPSFFLSFSQRVTANLRN